MNDPIPLHKVCPDRTDYNQFFAVVSWGCAATTWLAKVLNSHPEILCLHWGNGAMAKFHGSMDSLQYFEILNLLGQGYTAVGDVHGLPRTDIPKLKETFADRFNAAIVVREPFARLVALYERNPGVKWDLSYGEMLIESKNIVANSEESRMFVHAAGMLNSVIEEISYGLESRRSVMNARGVTCGLIRPKSGQKLAEAWAKAAGAAERATEARAQEAEARAQTAEARAQTAEARAQTAEARAQTAEAQLERLRIKNEQKRLLLDKYRRLFGRLEKLPSLK